MTRPDLSALKGQQLYWEDLNEGDQFDSPTRTITEADVANFACLSGDFNRLHVDAEYAADSAFGQRIAHGLLVVSVMSGLTTRPTCERCSACVSSHRCCMPTRIGPSRAHVHGSNPTR